MLSHHSPLSSPTLPLSLLSQSHLTPTPQYANRHHQSIKKKSCSPFWITILTRASWATRSCGHSPPRPMTVRSRIFSAKNLAISQLWCGQSGRASLSVSSQSPSSLRPTSSSRAPHDLSQADIWDPSRSQTARVSALCEKCLDAHTKQKLFFSNTGPSLFDSLLQISWPSVFLWRTLTASAPSAKLSFCCQTLLRQAT